MKLSLENKKVVVAEVASVAQTALSLVAADYSGLTVPEMTELRAKAREAGVYLRVVRNTLARRAFEKTTFECVSSALVGPLFLAFSKEEPGAAARLLKQFAKDHEKLEVKIISIDGQVMDGSALEAIASLPTRDEAIVKLMLVMRAPMEKFARTLKETQGKLVRTLAAVRDKKQAEG
ncbi:MAG: 50S ribosomal protein L10 [Proteobacteria bacterium]|nr:50S ribosomal protein L10 [Pseudomonadota bacterium]